MAKKIRRKKSAEGRVRRGKHVTPERLMEIGFAYAPPLIISAGVNNKVFDSLQNGAKTSEQIAEQTGASARALRILMNALVGLDLLKKDRQERYSLSGKRSLSSKQQAGYACRVFWNHCAAAHLTMGAIIRHRSRRSSGRRGEPGN